MEQLTPAARIWTVRLDAAPGDPGPLLSPAERARSDGFACPQERRRYRVAHAALRAVLAREHGGTPSRIDLGTDPAGRPVIAGCGSGTADFNLSRSEDWALIALAPPGCRIGVDIERVDPELDCLAMAMAHYRPQEVARLLAAPDAQRPTDFFRLWTAKEARVKVDGVGLAGLRELLVEDGAVHAPGAPSLPVSWLDVAPGYCAAVVVEPVTAPRPPAGAGRRRRSARGPVPARTP